MPSQNANIATGLDVAPGHGADIRGGFCSRGGESGETATSRSCGFARNSVFGQKSQIRANCRTSRSCSIRANSRFGPKSSFSPKMQSSGSLENLEILRLAAKSLNSVKSETSRSYGFWRNPGFEQESQFSRKTRTSRSSEIRGILRLLTRSGSLFENRNFMPRKCWSRGRSNEGCCPPRSDRG